MDKKCSASFLALALIVSLASGCASTRTLEDGTTDVVYRTPRASEIPERLKGAGIGMFSGALAGAVGAVLLTGAEPQAALYVSAVTVPAGAFLGFAAGLGNPAFVSNGALKVGAPPSPFMEASVPAISPELQAFVRTVAYGAHHYADSRKMSRKKSRK